MLRIYNSQTRSKEDFVPVDPNGRRVGMYYCGPTVYDSLHLGHARAAVVPDVMRRHLEYRGHNVRFVSNFTDVDDKIIKRAMVEKRPWREITQVYIDEWHQLTVAMGNRPADVHPRATDHIDEMVALVESIMNNGHAYVASNGDVYFDVASFDNYGELSQRNLEDQAAGSSGRISDEALSLKRSPEDFILWKLGKNDPETFREHPEAVPAWSSPWGDGRPGWHLECSSMTHQYLGAAFDIHGGGMDLLFPHHENEKAQNECGYHDELCGRPSVRYWVHNGFVTVKARHDADRASEYADGELVKMSKSLGNVKWLREMMWPHGPYDPIAVRMMLIAHHYRSPIHFSAELLDQATSRLDRIYTVLEALTAGAEDPGALPIAVALPPDHPFADSLNGVVERYGAAMDDDFNTPGALAALAELVSLAHKELITDGRAVTDESAQPAIRSTAGVLVRLLRALGIRPFRQDGGGGGGDDEIDAVLGVLGRLRQQARADKQWALADAIRDELGALGWEVRDRPDADFEIVRKS
ncbi:MAG: cysteine--tRNA ligase [Acidobacteriota bacterium]